MITTSSTSQLNLDTFTLTVPKDDVNFFKTIVKKMGWTVERKKTATKSKKLDVTKTADFKAAKDDVKNGRVYHAESVEDMFQKILGYVPGKV